MKPMLAISSTKLPKSTDLSGYIWSAKIDGFRCTIQRDHKGIPRAYTRSMKLHPNKHVQELFAREELLGLDGELVCDGDFHRMGGELRRKEGQPNVVFWVFDIISPGNAKDRIMQAAEKVREADIASVKILPQYYMTCMDWESLPKLNRHFVDQGYEGVCGRLATGHYREGRCGTKNPELIKVKDFVFSEAVVEDYFPLEHNENPQTLNELGQLKRSSHKGGKVTDYEQIGGLVLRHPEFSEEFHVGSGFSHSLRRQYMQLGGDLIGRRVAFKYQGIGSTKARPRTPIFIKLLD